MKIRGWVGEIYIAIVEALPTTEPPEYIWWSSTSQLLSTVDRLKRKRKFMLIIPIWSVWPVRDCSMPPSVNLQRHERAGLQNDDVGLCRLFSLLFYYCTIVAVSATSEMVRFSRCRYLLYGYHPDVIFLPFFFTFWYCSPVQIASFVVETSLMAYKTWILVPIWGLVNFLKQFRLFFADIDKIAYTCNGKDTIFIQIGITSLLYKISTQRDLAHLSHNF